MSTTRSSKSFVKWGMKLLNRNHIWTENDIIYFRKAIGSSGLKELGGRAYLIDLFVSNNKGYKITREHDLKGQQYILTKSYKRNGELRKGCIFSEEDLQVIKKLKHHKFVGLKATNPNRPYQDNRYLPIYRAYDTEGNYVEYVGTVYEDIQITGRG